MLPGTLRKGNGISGGVGKDLKQRVNICMNKLADRDTEAMAASELEAMARDLPAHSLPSFLSAVSDTRPSDKTPLRRHSLRLLSLLSRNQPPQSLSPFLPRMVSTVLRRLRDPDSSVRSACVNAVRDMSCSSCGGGASSSFNSHLKRLVPRLVNLVKKDSFKAKGDLLSVLGSIVAAGGASIPAMLGILVPCLADSLGSDDWAVRKAAAEALTCAAAIPDRQLLSGFKTSYFSSFHARRFDKVRNGDSMHRMLEKWKEVLGTLEDEDRCGKNTSPSHLQFSSLQQGSEQCHFHRLIIFICWHSCKKNPPKKNLKKASDKKIEITTIMGEDGQQDEKRCNEVLEDVRTKLEAQICAFENFEGRVRDFRVSKSRSRVIPVQQEGIPGHTLERNGAFGDRDGDLSMIRKQLVQIETQQSSLLDLLLLKHLIIDGYAHHLVDKRTSGYSKISLRELTTIYDIFFLLAVLCCKIPGAEFLSSKFWRRTEGRYSSMFSVTGGLAMVRARSSVENTVNSIKREKWTFGHQGGLVVNPLAEASPPSVLTMGQFK
ncbi:unnamed protein product [Spirodela intermedia]|uniref:TORTIFOLIA1/SINE1-2 N-terminal domain-containing protein n=1 Tax=Spirodela intermedia TaxID=51605 RepID=A0A7I8LCE2_SPIIN|nr:unnamed protein product [Spirodela intermedia]